MKSNSVFRHKPIVCILLLLQVEIHLEFFSGTQLLLKGRGDCISFRTLPGVGHNPAKPLREGAEGGCGDVEGSAAVLTLCSVLPACA